MTTETAPTIKLQTSRQNLNALARIRSLFAHLHDHGCARDKARNRKLHYDELLTLVVLALFQPLARSQRALSQISDLKSVRKRFGIPHAAVGSISEAARIFDPEPLRLVLAELLRNQPQGPHDPRLAALKNPLTAFDGSLLDALPRFVESAWGHHRDGSPRHKWRLHLQFDVAESIPDVLDLTGPKNSGGTDEKTVLKSHLRPQRTYLVDRWMGHVLTLEAIVAAGSDYVARLRNNIHLEPLQANELTDEAVAAGVTFDAVVRVGTKGASDHPMRVVILRVPPHPKRKGAVPKGPVPLTEIRLVTNLLDLPAEMIGLLYRYRWTVETFFRFFKQTLGCVHLLWDDPRGIRLQAYCALIAYLLIQQTSGRKPTKATFRMLSFYLTGWADWSEVKAHLDGLKPVTERKMTSR